MSLIYTGDPRVPSVTRAPDHELALQGVRADGHEETQPSASSRHRSTRALAHMKASFLDILVNGKRVATIGPLRSEHCSVSVSTLDDKLLLIASGMYKKGGTHQWLSWIDKAIPLSASVTVARSEQRRASAPLRKRNLRLGQKATPKNLFCDFCKQKASRSRRVVQAGDSPFICLSCAELCVEIAKNK